MKKEIINARGLTIRTDKGLLLYNGTFSVYEGETLAFCQTSQLPSFLLMLMENPGFPYEGQISYMGKPLGKANPIEYSLVAGGDVLFESLSIADNLYAFAGKPNSAFYSRKRANAAAEEIMNALKLPFDIRMPIKALSISQRYMLELAKALLRGSRVIVLDNIMQNCNTDEFAWIISMLETYTKKGRTFILLSNEDNELISSCQRVYFFRGTCIADLIFQDEYSHQLFRRILYGDHETVAQQARPELAQTPVALEIALPEDLRVKSPLRVRAGEIYGIFDVYGTLAEKIYAAFQTGFPYRIDGVACENYVDAVRRGLAVVSLHRRDVLFETFSLEENLIFPALKRISHLGVIKGRVLKHCIQQYLPRLKRRYDPAEAELENLKLLMFRWMVANPKVMVLENPPLDLENSQQREVQALLREVTETGCAVILISSNASMGLPLCDRALILRRDGGYERVSPDAQISDRAR